jgi:hypothetical protein
MDNFNAAEAAARLMALEGGQPLQDGEGPGGIEGYLWRRGERRLGQAGKDAMYGLGAAAAGSVLAPATGGFSYVPGYGLAAMNLYNALNGVGQAANYGAASRQFGQMPEGPPPEEAMYARGLR